MQIILQCISSNIFQLPKLRREVLWPKSITSNRKSSVPEFTDPQVERTVVLSPEADWQEAVEKNLARQNLYNNVIKEIFNSLTRIVGWAIISMAIYGFSNVNSLSIRRRRRRSSGAVETMRNKLNDFPAEAEWKYS